MKAVQHIAYNEISESIKFSDIEKPTINKNEVLVETYAASVNPLDIKVITGKLKMRRNYTLPATMGYDVSGKIIEKGEAITNFNIGDEVYAYVDTQGTFAEYVSIKQNIVSLKPKNTTFEEAASLPLVSLTATQALRRGKLKSGDKILIHAGSGGVGSVAIQMAKTLGAYVYTTTSTDNVQWVKALGADRVIDYKTEDYKTIVKDVDMVLDTLGDDYTEDAFKVIKKGGKVITLVGPVDKETANRMKLNFFAKTYLAWKRRKITKRISEKAAYYSLVLLRPNSRQLNEITKLVESEKIKTNIEKEYPFKDTLNAVLHVANGRTKGKVVIKIK
ncbi:NADP-dependent oxidoreductase [Hwangdonia seohaensis]|uniref:NADP-dependent oxidoreductase n=1 Tax=Hwangdonia seohaensis TaxID=1240727 RepID=A0ABW3R7B5_9FLAO|nr:NADP-dependent oxidoreductase [Hwangdonia seohaensis]